MPKNRSLTLAEIGLDGEEERIWEDYQKLLRDIQDDPENRRDRVLRICLKAKPVKILDNGKPEVKYLGSSNVLTPPRVSAEKSGSLGEGQDGQLQPFPSPQEVQEEA